MPRAKALVVDDHRALTDNLVEILTEGLEDLKVELTIAPTAREALRAATADLDLALVDLHLPDAKGTSLINELRSGSPFAQVVIITGDSTVESAINAIREGAFGYVLKPFNAPDLLELSRRAIERAQLLREREALINEVEQSEARHRKLIESVPAFVLAMDSDQRILVWNRKLEEVTGYRRDEVVGKNGADLVGPASGDVRLPIRGGGHRMVRWQQSQVAAGPGEGAVTYAVGVDMTEELEMQQRARRAERLAAVGTLAAGLAHEVRNPLNSASLQLQVLERRLGRTDATPDAVRPIIGILHDEMTRLTHLLADFLSFARPRPLELERIRLNDLVASVAQLVEPECAAASISLEMELDPDTGYLDADQGRLRQVLINIVRNAMEAIGKDGTIRMRTSRADDHGFVGFDVEDTGPGFAEDAPVFDAFYTTKGQGTGLAWPSCTASLPSMEARCGFRAVRGARFSR